MEQGFLDLAEEFRKIKKKGYVESVSIYRSRAGDTFEQLLGKERDELFLADFEGIEIKTKKGYSKSPVTLFSANPDDEYYFSLKRLLENYGIMKNGMPNMLLEVSSNKYTYYNKHCFKLEVDWQNMLLKLNIYDLNKKLLDDSVSWSFSLLKERINFKLQNLALVKCCTKEINKKEHYWYYKMIFYKNLTFESFIRAIESGKIIVTFSIGIYKSGPKIGKLHNHGTSFRIMEDDLMSLYDKMYLV